VTNTATTGALPAGESTIQVTAVCATGRLIGGGAAATTSSGTMAGRVAIQESVPTNVGGTTTAPFDRWRGKLLVNPAITTGTATIRAWAVCISP
jgi:hypothetical protein